MACKIIHFPKKSKRVVSPDFERAIKIFSKCLRRSTIEAVEAYIEGKIAMGAISVDEADFMMNIFEQTVEYVAPAE